MFAMIRARTLSHVPIGLLGTDRQGGLEYR
jgi:hypothetical protein